MRPLFHGPEAVAGASCDVLFDIVVSRESRPRPHLSARTVQGRPTYLELANSEHSGHSERASRAAETGHERTFDATANRVR